jgi:hypothetical protein
MFNTTFNIKSTITKPRRKPLTRLLATVLCLSLLFSSLSGVAFPTRVYAATATATLALTANAVITEPTQVMGAATSGASYTLSYGAATIDDAIPSGSGANPLNYVDFKPFATGTGTGANTLLGTFDPTFLHNGYYDIRLVATDAAGTATADVLVSVTGGVKVGNYAVGFNDISMLAGNFPVGVSREYDSRDKAESGDFGYGWNMKISNVKLTKTGVAGAGWNQTSSGGFLATYTLNETQPHQIMVDWGNGQVDKFQINPSPKSQRLSPRRGLSFV